VRLRGPWTPSPLWWRHKTTAPAQYLANTTNNA